MIVNDFATVDGARAFSQEPSLPAAMQRLLQRKVKGKVVVLPGA